MRLFNYEERPVQNKRKDSEEIKHLTQEYLERGGRIEKIVDTYDTIRFEEIPSRFGITKEDLRHLVSNHFFCPKINVYESRQKDMNPKFLLSDVNHFFKKHEGRIDEIRNHLKQKDLSNRVFLERF